MTPDFLWVGLGKSGSSLTFMTLSRHPRIHLGRVKEHNFFSDPDRFAQGAAYWQTHLGGAQPGQITGDISPGYYRASETVDRIVQHYQGRALPRILFCLRNPARFIVSRFRQTNTVARFFQTGRRFVRTLDQYARRQLLRDFSLRGALERVVTRLGGPENVCLLIHEEDFGGSYAYDRKIQDHLGLDYHPLYDPARDTHVNAGISPRFWLPSNADQTILHDGHSYRLPAGDAAFCSRPRYARVIQSPSPDFTRDMRRANDAWVQPMSPEMMQDIWQAQTEPLMQYVRATWGRTITSWQPIIRQPRYPDAPPPLALRVA